LFNTFEAAPHSGYLCLKVLATFGAIATFSNEKEARNIERGFARGQKNVHFSSEDADQHEPKHPSSKQEISSKFKRAIKVEGDFSRVALHPRVPDRTICIGGKMSPEERAELLQFLDKNSDVFACSTLDLVGASRKVIEHKLQVNPNAKPKKQKLRKM
jgi:hypothetical protein